MKIPTIDARVTILLVMAAAFAGCSALVGRSKAVANLKDRQAEISELSGGDASQ